MREAIEGRAGVATLAHMEAVDVIGDSLGREERVVAAEQTAIHRELYGDCDVPKTIAEADPMKFMAAHDNVVNHNYPAPPAKKTAGTLIKAAIGAALLATGVGAGAGIPWLMGAFGGGDKPAAVDTNTQYELRLGPPEAPGQD